MQVVLVVAEERSEEGGWEMVAGSLNLLGTSILYGRNWAASPDKQVRLKRAHCGVRHIESFSQLVTS
jgi:predicted N-acyltransferase